MPTLRVATLNLWNRSGPWERRLPLVREQLADLAPDVLGLQEVLRLTRGAAVPTAEDDQALAVAEGLGYRVAFGVATELGEGLAFGNALLSRYPILEQRVVPLPHEDRGQWRSVLHALLETPFGRLPVFVTHLHWRLHHGHLRLDQVRALVKAVFELAPTSAGLLPAVLLGDFNAEPDSDELRVLTGLSPLDGRSVYFADAWRYAGVGPGFTFDRQNPYAALAHEPPRRIDYVLVRGPDAQLRGEPVAARLCFDQPAEGPDGPVFPSDHFGVMADLHMSPRDPRSP